MDPFEDFNDIKCTFDDYIDIWVEVNGRKKNTYAINWNLSDGELKEHLKIIKTKLGCNGTIKKVINSSDSIKAVQLQGDHAKYLREYMISKGIEADLIRIKG